MGRIAADTLYGTLNVLILKTLSGGALHGLAIARSIGKGSDDFLRVEEGALYPALHRLEREGLLRSTWGASENNRRAKFYALTRAGTRRLQREVHDWAQHADAVAKVLEVRPSQSS